MKVQAAMILLFCLLAVSCSEEQRVQESEGDLALERATELVTKLNQSIKTDFTLAPSAWNGVPVVRITVDHGDSDYKATVDAILEASGSFEGELQVAVQTPMEVSEAERVSGVKDGTFILAHFNAKTGERIP